MTGYSYALTRIREDEGQSGVNCYMEGCDERITAAFLANEHWAGETTDTVTATVTSGGEKLKQLPQVLPQAPVHHRRQAPA